MSTAVEQLSSTQVGAFYDRLGAYFATVYGGESNIHFGYWDDAADSAGPREAQDRLTRMALAALDLSEGGWLLDVGCGTGGPARLAATESGCSVAGVTVSRTQVERAHREAARAGLAGRVRVQYADAMQLPFPDGSFDAVWALESVSCQPANDRAAVVWDRTGGSNALNDWRTDAQLVVDIEPIAGTDNVKLTARVRGLAITKEDNKGVWKRAESYWATGELKLQARDVNGSFTVVVREQTRGEIKVAGVEPAEPCTLTYTLPRAQLIDHAIDFSYHVDDATRISRATVSGRCVLNIPPSMDTYRPGTVRDPATGERSGDKTTANTPIQHKLHGYAKLTTADAGNGADTNITANVHISVTGMLGAPELLTKVSVLERYDAQKDAWVSVASRSTRKTKGMTSSSVDADTLTARVAGKIAPLWNTSS